MSKKKEKALQNSIPLENKNFNFILLFLPNDYKLTL